MDRRRFLAGTLAVVGATAGCVGDAATGSPEDDPSDSPTGTSTPAPPDITSRSLEAREECPEPGKASVATEGDTVTVEGCIVGRNGCQVAALGEASYDADADELRVLVVTEDGTDDDVCTQQLVHRGYAATVAFENGLPGTTVVVHDGVEGKREVARASTGTGEGD